VEAKDKEVIRYEDLMLSLQVGATILLQSSKPNG